MTKEIFKRPNGVEAKKPGETRITAVRFRPLAGLYL